MSRIRANTITNQNANGAPNFPDGITVTGVVTATTINQNVTGDLSVTGNIGVGGTLTYEDVTNIDSVGVITARSGIQIGVGGTIGSSGGGIVTYFGDGAQLTGISVDPSTAASSAGFLKVLNASTPQIRLNNDASDGATTRAFFGIASGSNNYITGSVANDTVLSGRVAGDLLIGVGSTIRMRIDELGRVTKPNNVSFMVKANANQSYSDGTVFVPQTPVTTGVCHNIGGHFNTSNGEFTAPVAGRYYLSMDCGCSFTSTAPTDGWQITIERNGSDSEIEDLLYAGGTNNYEDHITADGIFNLAAGDVIRWKMSGYGGSISFAKMKFQGYLLG